MAKPVDLDRLDELCEKIEATNPDRHSPLALECMAEVIRLTDEIRELRAALEIAFAWSPEPNGLNHSPDCCCQFCDQDRDIERVEAATAMAKD
jgi:hypothetical protein